MFGNAILMLRLWMHLHICLLHIHCTLKDPLQIFVHQCYTYQSDMVYNDQRRTMLPLYLHTSQLGNPFDFKGILTQLSFNSKDRKHNFAYCRVPAATSLSVNSLKSGNIPIIAVTAFCNNVVYLM